jgi:serine/threonine protein kinase
MNIGKFEIIEEVGRGAMGIVYKARDPAIGRLVALKTLSNELLGGRSDALARSRGAAPSADTLGQQKTVSDEITGGQPDVLARRDAPSADTLGQQKTVSDEITGGRPDALTRFYREAQSAGTLDHPNIITIYELGDDKGIPYIAMEFLDGTDLARFIREKADLPLAKKIDIIVQICNGLAYAHQRGIIHRDIKPANILLRKDGVVKIVDFGIAHMASLEMTRSGVILGTASYLSPEQVEGRDVDGRSDIFSVGCLFYELLTYQTAFSGDSIFTIMYKIKTEHPRPVRNYVPTLNPAIDRIINKALAKDREQRYQSAQEFAQDLQAGLGAVEEKVPPIWQTTWVRALGIVLLLSLTLGVAYYYATRHKQSDRSIVPPPITEPAEPAKGYLSLNVLPWGEIKEIVNVKTGKAIPTGDVFTPVQLSLPAGSYRLTLANPYFKQNLVLESVQVEENKSNVIKASFPGYDIKAYMKGGP